MHSLRFEEDAKKMLALLTPPGKIIDGQIGQGGYSQLFRDSGFEVVGFHGPRQIEEILIPHRTISGIWLADSCQDSAPARLSAKLSVCVDWLVPGGYIAFVLRAGEGIKRVNTQIVYQYQGEQVDVLLQSCALKPVHAWLDGPLERQCIHVIAQVV